MLCVFLVVVNSCSYEGLEKNNLSVDSAAATDNSVEAQIQSLKDQFLALTGTSNLITGLVSSDFATCPLSGNTSDALINKICKVAQAANAEQLIAIKDQLSSINNMLKEKLNAINDDIATLNDSLASDEALITTIQGNITSLTTSLNNLISTVNGTLTPIEIGSENSSAGPSYESVMRLVDKSKIYASTQSYNSGNITLGSNPITPVNGSATVTITRTTSTVTATGTPSTFTWTTHPFTTKDPILFTTTNTLPTGITASKVYYVNVLTNNTFQVSATPGGTAIGSGAGTGTHKATFGLVVGDTIFLAGLTAGVAGYVVADITGDHKVTAVTNPGSFQIVLRKTATASTAFGGAAGYFYKFYPQGLNSIWATANGADTAVRSTTIGTIPYNYAITSTGDICYDTTNAAQTFANIITTPTVNVICK